MAGSCSVFERLRRRPQRVVFAEGEEEQVIRAAASFVQEGLGTALLVGREDRVRASARPWALSSAAASRSSMRGCRSATHPMRPSATNGCSAMAFSSAMCAPGQSGPQPFRRMHVALDDADAMVTGVTVLGGAR